jgi:hypothetical protein
LLPEDWSVLSPPTPIFGKLGLNLGNLVQFKCDPEQIMFWNLTPASKGTPMEVCGHAATQYGESDKCFISFSPKSEDRTPQYSGNKIALHTIKTETQNFKLNLYFNPKGIPIIRGITHVVFGTTTRPHYVGK